METFSGGFGKAFGKGRLEKGFPEEVPYGSVHAYGVTFQVKVAALKHLDLFYEKGFGHMFPKKGGKSLGLEMEEFLVT
jgi:hypothetical protein